MTEGSSAWTVLAIVRHGQAESNLQGTIGGQTASPLTDLGQRQARRVAAFLADDFGPTAVITSDLMRARQTAVPIAQECAVELVQDARLRERTLGEMDGLRFEDAAARYPDIWRRLRARDYSVDPPGAERVEAVYQRMAQALTDIVAAHQGGRVVLVSHGIAIFHAFCHIVGADGAGDPSRPPPVFTLVGNCSVTRVTRRDGYWYLSTLNETHHLAGLE